MGTWKLVPPPKGQKIIWCKWVFRVKQWEDGSILKLKAQLVAMGFSQVQGLYFYEVFAPNLRMESLCLVLSLLGHKDWIGRQIDFKTAFLNGQLDKPMYMSQPPGFEDPSRPDWVCKVSCAIYGLRQSPRQWNLELSSAMVSLGLAQSLYNPALYYKIVNGELVGPIAAHVDNLAVVGTPTFVASFIKDISKTFQPHSSTCKNVLRIPPWLLLNTTSLSALCYGSPNALAPKLHLLLTGFHSSSKTPRSTTGMLEFGSLDTQKVLASSDLFWQAQPLILPATPTLIGLKTPSTEGQPRVTRIG